jgi:recombination associated protein RdgC
MAFTKQGSVGVWIDPKSGWLVLDAGSQGKADEVMTALIKAIPDFAVQLVNTQISPAAAMAVWLSTRESPTDFSVDRECELKASDESKAVVRYTRHPLDTEEVSQHIALGKMPTRLAMTWNDRVSFVLTEALQLKKVTFLDTVFEEASKAAGDGKDDNFDADVIISTGELSQLIPDLMEALGGEVPLGSMPGASA